MARFNFKLQGILNIKLKMEEQEKLAFAEARMRLNEEQDRLSALYNRKEEILQEKKQNMSGSIRFVELQVAENAINGLDLAIDDQKRAVRRAEKGLAIAEERLNEAMKERKTYEKLRENAFEEFMALEAHNEQMEINELVAYRHSVAEE